MTVYGHFAGKHFKNINDCDLGGLLASHDMTDI
ncbi:hypothetical protein S2091_3539 [Solimicrobium silvestre]|uniref:Uncharacterized protein n=1 Tax=Solimicrobium silvestre TaxID=2099400 RepID=A0A2S9GVP3_9BURK|nr:hypothetical protein S2091_3539 [Solimicrobium silvestre]